MTTCMITLDDMICFDVYAANLAIGRLYKPLLTQFGVTYPQYLVLMSLWEKDGQAVGEIGALLGLESSTLTPLIKRLAAAGMVTRLRAVEDERKVHISLTEKGRDMANRRDQMAECLVGAAGLTLQEFQQLRELLRKMRSNLA
ncbi:MarR family winged helix-turn-helix transcriptional regulator [Yoonia maritima]|uniref:MarR family winged helix-turn-helix transcriptional regulator n=1 Tax=Yoonia maritima TaxID=1435347 RepID=UPI000D10F9F9|nr:MarR family transcriptional regulator [Yoonia maritima]